MAERTLVVSGDFERSSPLAGWKALLGAATLQQTDRLTCTVNPFYPYRHKGLTGRGGTPPLTRAEGTGEERTMDAKSRQMRLASRSHACGPTRAVVSGATSVAAGNRSTRPTPAGRQTPVARWEAAGGAVGIVAAGGFGSDRARGAGPQDLNSWRRRAQIGVHGLSGRTGRRERYGLVQIRTNLSKAPTPECECMSMYGIEGRVVPGAIAVAGYSVSSAVRAAHAAAGKVGEPARGVMGGLLQPTTPSVEPPVSSLNGSARTPTTTAPAPIGVLTTGVSPRVSAAGAAVGAEPAGR